MTHAYKWIRLSVLMMFLSVFTQNALWAQARIQVRVVSVSVLNNVDCDGIFHRR
jgi:hypothetical protein